MLIEIEPDFADEIVRQGLLESYFSIEYDLNRVKHGYHAHPEDLARWQEVLPALEIVGNWYFHDFEKAKKEYKKKLK